MSEWQPIETAPKDGSRILLYPLNGAEECFVGYFDPDMKDESYGETGWVDNMPGLSQQPKLWMPIPERPK